MSDWSDFQLWSHHPLSCSDLLGTVTSKTYLRVKLSHLFVHISTSNPAEFAVSQKWKVIWLKIEIMHYHYSFKCLHIDEEIWLLINLFFFPSRKLEPLSFQLLLNSPSVEHWWFLHYKNKSVKQSSYKNEFFALAFKTLSQIQKSRWQWSPGWRDWFAVCTSVSFQTRYCMLYQIV